MQQRFHVSRTFLAFTAATLATNFLAFAQESLAAGLEVRANSSSGDELVLSFPTLPFAETSVPQSALMCAASKDGTLALTSARLLMNHDGQGHGGPRVTVDGLSTRCTRIARMTFPHSGEWSVKVVLESGAKAEFSFNVAESKLGNVRMVTTPTGATVALTFPSDAVSAATTTATVCADSDRAIDEVAPWMPDMGHGTSPTRVTRLSLACHAVEELDLFMPGPWEFRVRFAGGETTSIPVDVSP